MSPSVHFNNRSMSALDLPEAEILPWYRAYRRFAAIMREPAGELRLRLSPGDLLIMENNRALHGRTAFDPNLGRRHLQGCYVDKDGVESRRRVLQAERGMSELPKAIGRARSSTLYERKGEMSYGEGVSMNAHGLQAALLAEQEEAGHGPRSSPPCCMTSAICCTSCRRISPTRASIPSMNPSPRPGCRSISRPRSASRCACMWPPSAISAPPSRDISASYRPASVQSLELQGGPMSPREVARFAAEPFAGAAVRLRRWDDLAKRTDLATPDFAHYRPMIEAVLKR